MKSFAARKVSFTLKSRSPRMSRESTSFSASSLKRKLPDELPTKTNSFESLFRPQKWISWTLSFIINRWRENLLMMIIIIIITIIIIMIIIGGERTC